MGTHEKRIEKLKDFNKSITFDEVNSILIYLGFELNNKGKTSGSRVLYIRVKDNTKIMLHKPHPGNEIKSYARKQLIKTLEELGDI